MKPGPAPLQMSRAEFSTASPSRGRRWKKTLLYLGAGTAHTDSNCCDSKAGRERVRHVRPVGVTTGGISDVGVSLAAQITQNRNQI